MLALHNKKPWSELLYPKALLPDQASLFSGLQPRMVGFYSVKVAMLVLTKRLNVVVKKLEVMDEKDEELSDDVDMSMVFSPTKHEHELNIWQGFASHFKTGLGKELSVNSLLRLFEHVIVFAFDYRVARSMTKNGAYSAIRKVQRGYGGFTLCAKVFQSTLKSQALSWVSLFVVHTLFDVVFIVVPPPQQKPEDGSNKMYNGKVLRIVKTNAKSFLVGYVCSAIGATIGTMIKPGMFFFYL